VAILYYDWALTFDLEILSIWRRPIKASTILYVINRYFSIVGNVFVTIVNLKTLPSQVCSKHCLTTLHLISTSEVRRRYFDSHIIIKFIAVARLLIYLISYL
jgi:hypothetical protein